MVVGGVFGALVQRETLGRVVSGHMESPVTPPRWPRPAARNAIEARIPAAPPVLAAEEPDVVPVDGIVVPFLASNFTLSHILRASVAKSESIFKPASGPKSAMAVIHFAG